MGHADDKDEKLRCPENFPSIPGAYVMRYRNGDNLNVLHRRYQEKAEHAVKTLDTVLGAPEISDRALVRNLGVNDLVAKLSHCHSERREESQLPEGQGLVSHANQAPRAWLGAE